MIRAAAATADGPAVFEVAVRPALPGGSDRVEYRLGAPGLARGGAARAKPSDG